MTEPRPWNDRVFTKLLSPYTPLDLSEPRKRQVLEAMLMVGRSEPQPHLHTPGKVRPGRKSWALLAGGLAAAAVLILTIGLLVPRLSTEDSSTTWISYGTDGSAQTTTPAPGSQPRQLASKQAHTLETRRAETLVLERQGLRLEMGENSRLSIEPQVSTTNAAAGGERDRIELLVGSLVVAHTSAQPDFELKTVHVMIQPIGTAFFVRTSESGTFVHMRDGAVSVTLGDGTIERLEAPKAKLYAPTPDTSAETNQSSTATTSGSASSTRSPATAGSVPVGTDPVGPTPTLPTKLWSRRSPLVEKPQMLHLSEDRVVLLGPDGMAGLSLADGSTVWSRPESAAAARILDSRIVIRTSTQLLAVDLEAGTTVWQISAPPIQSGSFSLAQGRILLGGADGKLLSIEPSNGTILSETVAEFGFFGSPLVVSDRIYIKQLPQAIAVYGFGSGAVSAEPIAVHNAPFRLGSAELINQNGIILVSDTRGSWQALDPQTGSFVAMEAPIINGPNGIRSESKKYLVQYTDTEELEVWQKAP